MFSSTAEYALRAVAYLATHPGSAATSEVIADATKVPQGYLLKILSQLAEVEIVGAKRGPSGGFVLRRSAGLLSVLEVVNAVDSIKRIHTCPLGLPSHGTKLCKLHRRLDNAIATVEKTLAETTMAEMVERESIASECSFPLEPRELVKPTVKGRATKRGR